MKMHQTFTSNLQDATDAEAKAKADYEKLIASKDGQLTAAQEALNKMESEGGAKGMSRQESQDEVDALKTQVTNDEKFIKQTQDALTKKKASWKVRSDLRAGELAAISKAISILHNDDARDLFKKSFDSQFFLQLGQTSQKTLVQKARAAIQDAARRSGDQRLLSLATDLAPFKSVKGRFAPIITAIDKMIANLKSEEQQDLDTKQTCESDRMENTRKAIDPSRTIDEQTDEITALTARIAQCEKTIAELVAALKETKEELDKATRQRNDENKAWKQTDSDDKAAAETVLSAKEVLAGFYKDNNLALVQKATQPVTEDAGAAPPPSTWEGDYGGKTGESQGIIAIMEMVREDIIKDRADAKADEDDSQTEFDNYKKDSEARTKELNADKDRTEKDMGQAETKKTDTERQRRTQKGELNAVLKKIRDIDPNCEYYEVNYPMRRRNRQIEIDGLDKAKAILKGGSFDAGPDPNREMKVGDAASAVLLQRNRA